MSALDPADAPALERAALRASRLDSPYALQRYVHEAKFRHLLRLLEPGETLLEVGRGGSVDGVFAVLAAVRGHRVAISVPDDDHARALRAYAHERGVAGRTTVVTGAPDALPLPARSFDVVASLHVLEHVRDPAAVVAEICRLTRDRGIVALPTCLNAAAVCRLGGGNPYRPGRDSARTFLRGSLKLLSALVRRADGLAETQIQDGVPWRHEWLFPWAMKRRLTGYGTEIRHFGADALCIPWSASLIPVMRLLDRLNAAPVANLFGMGSHAVISEKRRKATSEEQQ
ncbi:class I SAM-dependent methyltransferase [Streptomyces sp. NPDC021020]|uniref:class I SAM-dependent methyltransferase n=1 Tax=Streptomyces sp. NPDC021020 TaxID=3365109 RepID=UPI003791C72F